MGRLALLVVASLLLPLGASAQIPAERRAPLEAAFSALAEGKYLEAEAGFLRAAVSAPEGSPERWLARELSALARRLGEGPAAPLAAGAERESFSTAASQLLDGKTLEARAAFLR